MIYVPDPEPDSVFVITAYELVGKPGNWVMFLNNWPKMISHINGCTNVNNVHMGMRTVIFMYLLNKYQVSASMHVPHVKAVGDQAALFI